MKYGIMPKMMWTVFKPSFKGELPIITRQKAKPLMQAARQDYQSILHNIPKFDNDDRFLVNILSAAMLAAVLEQLLEKPDLEQVTSYYHRAMNNNCLVKLFLRRSDNYNEKVQKKLVEQALNSQKRNNPYSWKFRYEPGPSVNSYTVTFSTCGICHLFNERGLTQYLPAMCTYDYDMTEQGGTVFTRQYTLASGGPFCDCHYQKREACNEAIK